MTFPTYRITGGPNAKGSKIVDTATGLELRGIAKITLVADASDRSGIWRAEIVLLDVEVDVTVPKFPDTCRIASI